MERADDKILRHEYRGNGNPSLRLSPRKRGERERAAPSHSVIYVFGVFNRAQFCLTE